MSQNLIPVTETFFVSPQISAEDIRAAKDAGFTLIVNNRPDGEIIGQPKSADLERAAREEGLSYIYLPVDSGGITADLLSRGVG